MLDSSDGSLGAEMGRKIEYVSTFFREIVIVCLKVYTLILHGNFAFSTVDFVRIVLASRSALSVSITVNWR